MKRLGILIAGSIAALVVPAFPTSAACHVINFSPSTYTVSEAAGQVTLTVTNNGGAQTQDQMVDYATANGSAKAPMDYVSKNGSITFTVGAPDTVTIDIPIKNDTIDEPAEQFQVKLSNVRPPGSCAPPPNISGDTATITISDNDPKPIIKPKPKPSPTPTVDSPRPSPRRTTPSPSPSRTPSPSPSPTVSASPSPTPTTVAAPDTASHGGISGGALAGIVGGVVVIGGAAALLVRRRFMT